MNEKKRVDAVIKANAGWTESDAEFLTEVDETSFGKIEATAIKANAGPEEAAVAAFLKSEKGDTAKLVKFGATSLTYTDADGAEKTMDFTMDDNGKLMAKQATPPPPPKANSAEEFIKSAPTEFQDVLRSGLKTHNAQKAALVAGLKGNARCKFSEQQLNAKDLDELKALAELAHVEVDFSAGAGEAEMHANADADEVPAMPEVKW